MKLPAISASLLTLSACFLLTAMNPSVGLAASNDYFKVTNTTDSRITKLLLSENKRKWGYFDVGKGIPPGKTITLRWGKNTGDQACEQYIKAVFDDGTESKPVEFDFCEEGLELEF